MNRVVDVHDIYEDTQNVYRWAAPFLGEKHAHGFKIMYSPPMARPRALLIGYQPGGDRTHGRPDEEVQPSRLNEYLTENWPLARELRKRFGTSFLESSVGLNAIFFRSPSTKIWREVDEALRREIETFCRTRALEIVRRLEPKVVLILGWDALEAVGGHGFVERVGHAAVVGRRRRRRLAQTGLLAGVPAVAIPHPTAAWRDPPVTDQDWNEIAAVVGSVAE
jgi:hypothetical protein